MIDWLRGVVRAHRDDRLVLDVNGVGYGLELAMPPDQVPAVGESAELHVYTHVSESAIRLFGFKSQLARDMFEVVTGVSGVGPKLGQALLASLDAADLAWAILQSDLKRLTAVSGVGKKTAERLVLELRDKMASFAAAGSSAKSASMVGGRAPDDLRDVVDALAAFGLKPAGAERAAMAARQALGEGASFQDLFKEALKHR